MSIETLMKEAGKLTPAEKADLVDFLIADLASSGLTSIQAADLRQRIDEDEANPNSGRSLDDVMRDWKKR